MSNAENLAFEAIDREHADESSSTRRRFVGGAAATLGGMGLLGATGAGSALAKSAQKADPQNILNIAATAEVLATIVNTVGAEVVALDDVTRKNVQAAAVEEFTHYKVLRALGGRPATKKIWVPSAAVASATDFLSTLVVGDQVFINAYLIATQSFGNRGDGKAARFAAQTMGAEAVHRALALQSLGQLGNDRVFMKYKFTNINHAPVVLQKKGFGFGKEGSAPGAFFDFDEVKKRVPNVSGVNTFKP